MVCTTSSCRKEIGVDSVLCGTFWNLNNHRIDAGLYLNLEELDIKQRRRILFHAFTRTMMFYAISDDAYTRNTTYLLS